MHPYRTHTCGALRSNDVSRSARLSGWVFRKRDHGQLLFLDLRDHYGLTQVVIHPDREFFELCTKLKLESIITVTGVVVARSPDTVNSDLPTGAIELVADAVTVESVCEPLPLQIDCPEDGPEDIRLHYRYLDLRRERLHRNIILRSRVISYLRQKMTELGFNEFQTPILTSSSPEGARDYLVPSRVHPGKFYALPQAPQQFKQLLMVAGFDRYFQIAPCFRDEDARADRSPGEFYQLDLEMSFATQADVFQVVEEVMAGVFGAFSSKPFNPPPFPRIPYAEAMLKYGSDKPDLRIPIVMQDATGIFKGGGFKAFASVIEQGGVVRAVPVKGIAGQPRSFFDKLVDYAKSIGSKGLAYLVWEGGIVKGPIVKFLTPDQIQAIAGLCEVGESDVVFFVCDRPALVNKITGDLRLKLGNDLKLADQNVFKFCWIVDFPMFETDPETNRITFSHNPFSMPQGGMQAIEEQDPLSILAYQYDIVCNGCELSSGAIRNHSPDIMYKAFAIAGYSREDVDEKFSGMINAFRLGAPPHGGIAPGLDRIVMLLAGEQNIREVIAFPMNQKAQDLMMDAPAPVADKQLRELHLKVVPPKTAPAAVPPAEIIGPLGGNLR
ncbi:MAG: aspartate--tRNA ligase [Verrucomicrobia bacterium]|nr:aspartate--tRNA ligase [Verrucomicrobiota bacterium]MBU4291732.1 aspartate--tRNA ligase [Verrucomicrobiota bacterium]MBU4427783.1 aspartate--tRNA ligase [Verrucomicrobiota bacterium]MCG2681283.1 aspartate--tRNA ligase [Kiritimatiellia bacterium]